MMRMAAGVLATAMFATTIAAGCAADGDVSDLDEGQADAFEPAGLYRMKLGRNPDTLLHFYWLDLRADDTFYREELKLEYHDNGVHKNWIPRTGRYEFGIVSRRKVIRFLEGTKTTDEWLYLDNPREIHLWPSKGDQDEDVFVMEHIEPPSEDWLAAAKETIAENLSALAAEQAFAVASPIKHAYETLEATAARKLLVVPVAGEERGLVVTDGKKLQLFTHLGQLVGRATIKNGTVGAWDKAF